MINILSTLDVIVAILLIAIILMQKSEGGVLGMGGGAKMGGMLTTTSAGSLLTKLTVWLGVAFFAITIFLALLISHQHRNEKSGLEKFAEQKEITIDAPKADNKIDENKMLQDQQNSSKPAAATTPAK